MKKTHRRETRRYSEDARPALEIGTSYQRLMLRTPLACVSRGPAKAYTPLPAKVELAKKPVVLKAVMAQISRPEYLAKRPRYTEDSGPQIGDKL